MKNRIYLIGFLIIIAATITFAGGGNNTIEFSQNNLSLQTQINNGILSIATESAGRIASDADIIATQALHAAKLDPVTTVASTTALSTEESNRIASDAALASYAEGLAAQSSLRYYFQELESGSPAGYELLATSATTIQSFEPSPKTITSTTDWTLIDTWISATGTPNLATFVLGIYEVQFYVTKTQANNSVNMVFGLWSRTTGNVETQIATSSIYTIVGALTQQRVTCNFTVPVTSVSATDRIVIKQYGKKVGAGTDPTIQNYYGSITEGFFGLPISPRNFARTDLSNLTTDALVNAGIASTTALAEKVAKSGDTMTGDLTLIDNNGGSPNLWLTATSGSNLQQFYMGVIASTVAPCLQICAPTLTGNITSLSLFSDGYIFNSDNQRNIGSAGDKIGRPKNIHVGTDVNASGTIRAGLDLSIGRNATITGDISASGTAYFEKLRVTASSAALDALGGVRIASFSMTAWTPYIRPSEGVTENVTYGGETSGYFYKVGAIVFITGTVQLTARGDMTPSANPYIVLPKVSASVGHQAIAITYLKAISIPTDRVWITMAIPSATDAAYLWGEASNVTPSPITVSNLASDSKISFTGCYMAEE